MRLCDPIGFPFPQVEEHCCKAHELFKYQNGKSKHICARVQWDWMGDYAIGDHETGGRSTELKASVGVIQGTQKQLGMWEGTTAMIKPQHLKQPVQIWHVSKTNYYQISVYALRSPLGPCG